MSWLRLDDGFDTHRKILALGSDQRRWTWQRVLLYTCRHRSDEVPDAIRDAIPKATPAFIRDCIRLGLVDLGDDGVKRVHDWSIYNGGTLEERIAAFLTQNPDASANEVQRAVGGKRELVLALVSALKAALQSETGGSSTGSPKVPRNRKGTVQGGSLGGSPTGSRSVLTQPHKNLPKAVTGTLDVQHHEPNGPGSENEETIDHDQLDRLHTKLAQATAAITSPFANHPRERNPT